MKNPWNEVKAELLEIAELPLEQFADDYLSLEKENQILKLALADKQSDPFDKSDMVVVYKHELKELIQLQDCRLCVCSTCRGKCASKFSCEEMTMRWLCRDWEGMGELAEKEDEEE